MPIVWTFPDRHIEVTHLTEEWLEERRRPDESTAHAVERLAVEVAAKTPHLRQGVPHLVKSADMPTDRSQRADWTFDASSKRVRPLTPREKEERDRPTPPR